MYFFTSAPAVVVPLSPCGSIALCAQAVVPPLGSTTMSGFCYFRLFAEVGTEVPLPPGWDFCLAVVPHGGAVVLRVRKYRPQLASVSVLGSRQYRGTVRLYRTAVW